MKILGRILALLIAGVISVLTVQQFIRRMYTGFGGKYIDLPSDGTGDDTAYPDKRS